MLVFSVRSLRWWSEVGVVNCLTADNDEVVSSASCDSTSDQITDDAKAICDFYAPAGPSLGSRER